MKCHENARRAIIQDLKRLTDLCSLVSRFAVSGKRGASLAPQREAVGAGNSVQPCLMSSVGPSFSSLIAVGPGRGPTLGWTGPCPESAQ